MYNKFADERKRKNGTSKVLWFKHRTWATRQWDDSSNTQRCAVTASFENYSEGTLGKHCTWRSFRGTADILRKTLTYQHFNFAFLFHKTITYITRRAGSGTRYFAVWWKMNDNQMPWRKRLTKRSQLIIIIIIIKVKWSRYRPGMAQRVGRGIALLFHDRGTRRGWVVSSTPRPHFTPGKDPIPILQEIGWAPGPAWKGGKSRPYRDSTPDRPSRSRSLYRLSYPAHSNNNNNNNNNALICRIQLRHFNTL